LKFFILSSLFFILLPNNEFLCAAPRGTNVEEWIEFVSSSPNDQFQIEIVSLGRIQDPPFKDALLAQLKEKMEREPSWRLARRLKQVEMACFYPEFYRNRFMDFSSEQESLDGVAFFLRVLRESSVEKALSLANQRAPVFIIDPTGGGEVYGFPEELASLREEKRRRFGLRQKAGEYDLKFEVMIFPDFKNLKIWIIAHELAHVLFNGRNDILPELMEARELGTPKYRAILKLIFAMEHFAIEFFVHHFCEYVSKAEVASYLFNFNSAYRLLSEEGLSKAEILALISKIDRALKRKIGLLGREDIIMAMREHVSRVYRGSAVEDFSRVRLSAVMDGAYEGYISSFMALLEEIKRPGQPSEEAPVDPCERTLRSGS